MLRAIPIPRSRSPARALALPPQRDGTGAPRPYLSALEKRSSITCSIRCGSSTRSTGSGTSTVSAQRAEAASSATRAAPSLTSAARSPGSRRSSSRPAAIRVRSRRASERRARRSTCRWMARARPSMSAPPARGRRARGAAPPGRASRAARAARATRRWRKSSCDCAASWSSWNRRARSSARAHWPHSAAASARSQSSGAPGPSNPSATRRWAGRAASRGTPRARRSVRRTPGEAAVGIDQHGGARVAGLRPSGEERLEVRLEVRVAGGAQHLRGHAAAGPGRSARRGRAEHCLAAPRVASATSARSPGRPRARRSHPAGCVIRSAAASARRRAACSDSQVPIGSGGPMKDIPPPTSSIVKARAS